MNVNYYNYNHHQLYYYCYYYYYYYYISHNRIIIILRTIESFEDSGVDPIQEAIDDLLLPTLFVPTEPLPSDLRQLATLTPAQGRLEVPGLRFEAPQQFAAST